MPNRLRGNFLNGVVSSITAGNPATLTLADTLNIAIPSGYYLPIVLNPPPYVTVSGVAVSSEIVWTTGTYSTGTSIFTVDRAQEGTTSLGAQTNIPYAVGPTTQDFGLSNWIANEDFPNPTASGQFFTSTSGGANTPSWVFGYLVPSGGTTGQIVTISGGAPVFSNTISGSQIAGTLPNVTIAESNVTNLVSDLSSKFTTSTGLGGDLAGTLPNPTLAATGTAGTYGDAAHTPVITTDTKGRVTGVTEDAITIAESQVTNLTSDLSLKAPLASPALSGTPTAPTAGALTNDTQVATTAYTDGAVAVETTRAENAESTLLPKANNNATLTAPLESAYVLSTALAATQNIYVSTNPTDILVTVASTNNFIFNFAATSTVALNTLMVIGDSLTVSITTTNGATAYYCTGIQIDGTSTAINWQGGSAPAAGHASSLDVYTFNIKKTASATYTVLGSLVQF